MQEWQGRNPLKEWYTARGMSQVDVAFMLGVGVQAVQRWIAGASRPSNANFHRMAGAMQIPIDDLITAWDAWREASAAAIIAAAREAWNG